ncbi:hypothetical protein HGRIS_002132 [Hohenbuehelia grisea]|uniref:Uncharacterized protein n=1 Tax=Hohenbuehelia grisea TaxID=104357 RepID=A0ABR3JKN0_9AGAR
MVFFRKHVCLLDPWPQPFQDSLAKLGEDQTVYQNMLGPSEFNVTGNLKTWTVIDRLHTISALTLIINGVEDEAQDECTAPFFEHIPHAKWIQFAKSSHTPFYEESERYFTILGGFLTDGY